MCVICRKKQDPDLMIKITRVDGYWYVNNDNCYKGRSFYVDLDPSHIEKLKKQTRRFLMSDANMEEIIKTLEQLYAKQQNL